MIDKKNHMDHMNKTKTKQEGPKIVVDFAEFYGYWGATVPFVKNN